MTEKKQKTVDSKPRIAHTIEWEGDFRGISEETSQLYGVKLANLSVKGSLLTSGDEAINFRLYPYSASTAEDSPFKVRQLDTQDKKFMSIRTSPGVWGKHVFADNAKYSAAKRFLTITEGEEDAMSVYDMMGDYPVVSVQSASTAVRDCKADLDWLQSFDLIRLCFDMDAAGDKAAKAVSELFGYDKVVRIDMSPLKDANDWRNEPNGRIKFEKLWWSAKSISPDGIISSAGELLELAVKPIAISEVGYPWEGMNRLSYGLRTGETVLLTAQEGIGKTEVIRNMEHHILKNHPEERVGTMHLEENVTRQMKGFAGLELGYPVHLPDSPAGDDQIVEALQPLLEGNRLHVYQHFGSNNLDTILARIRFLARVCGCRWIFLDHISIIVSGSDDDGDERKALDRLSTKFASLVEELDICLIFVSHVNDEGKTRGSRNISKVADMRFDLHRDANNEDPDIANTTTIFCSKNRFSGERGVACHLKFDPSTFQFTEVSWDEAPSDKDKKSADEVKF